MKQRIIEVVSDQGNHGKFLVGEFDADDHARTDVGGASLIGPRWGRDHLLILDLETGEGVLLRPDGMPHADLKKHAVWVCPMYEPFLEWLYGWWADHSLDELPETLQLTGVEFQLRGYRRPGRRNGTLADRERALIIVDVQSDFCEGGSLPVPGGHEVAGKINDWIRDHDYRVVVASRDHHISPDGHFSPNPNFVDTWPEHCVVGTPGAEFAPELDATLIRHVFYKGMYEAAYSAFDGVSDLLGHQAPPGTGPHVTFAKLDFYLRQRDLFDLDIVGIELRNCVKATALDAVKFANGTRVIRDLVASLGGDQEQPALNEMAAVGVEIV